MIKYISEIATADKSVWKKDAEKIQFANTLGYKVIVVWEKEVKCGKHILKIKKEIA